MLTLLTSRRLEAVVASVIVVGHICVAVTHGGPVAVPDVPAYLSVSQWVWGGNLAGELAFYPGYGLLLSPFGWLPGSTVHTCALILNSFCAAGCVIILGRFARNLGLPSKYVAGVWLLGALHPSMSVASRIAWPEFVLILILSSITVLIQDRKTSRWRVAGVLAGISLAIHPRSIVIVFALLIVAYLAKRLKVLSFALVPTLVIPVTALTATGSWPVSRVSAATDGTSWMSVIAVSFGQIGALAAGTAGLAIVGAVMGVKQLRCSPKSVLENPAPVFLALGAAGMAVLGGVVLAGSNKADVFLYGRYIDLWALPLSVLGICYLRQRALTLLAAILSVVISLSGLIIAMIYSSIVEEPARRIMSLSLGAIWQIFDGRLFPTALLGASLVILIGFGISNRACYRLAPVLFALIAVGVSSTISDHHHLANVGRIADGQVTTASLIPSDAGCVSYDSGSVKSYALWLYRIELPKLNHEPIRLNKSQPPCGTYVVAGISALEGCRGARLLGSEPRADWGLWAYPETGCG